MAERDAELAGIDDLVADVVAHRGGLMVIEGRAGLGKSALLIEAADRARAADVTVLGARAAEMDRSSQFATVRRVFRPILAEMPANQRAALFSGVPELAGPVLLNGAAAPPSPDAALAGFHRLYWLLVDLAERGPILIVVDDAHWADDPSVDWFAYVASRLDGIRIGVVVTARPPEVASQPRLLHVAGLATRRYRLSLLSRGAVGALLADAGLGHIDSAFAGACHDVTGGNPFLLEEFKVEVGRRQLVPTADNADRLRALVPEGISRSVLARLASLSARAHAVARALAVLGDGAPVRHVAGVAACDVGEATDAALELAREEIIAHATPLAFCHPLVRSAVTSTCSPLELAALHARCATMLNDEGAEAEVVAAHLLHAEPDRQAWVVETLREAADMAMSRGASGNAAIFLARALQEPPEPGERFVVLWELGRAQSLSGEQDAITHLRAAVDEAPDHSSRAMVTTHLAWLLSVRGTPRETYETLRLLVDDDQTDHDQRAGAAVMLALTCADMSDLADQTREALDVAQSVAAPDSSAGKAVLALRGVLEAFDATAAASARDTIDAALDGGRLAIADDTLYPLLLAACALIHVDAFDHADAVLTDMLRHAEATGSVIQTGGIWCDRAMLELRRGRFADAEAAARLALDLFTVYGVHARRPQAAGYLTHALLERDACDEADAVMSGAVPDIERSRVTDVVYFTARARLRLAQFRHEDAVIDAWHAGRIAEAFTMTNPSISAWRGIAAEASFMAGDVAEARRLASEELALARQSCVPSAIGRALHVAGRVTDGDDLAMLAEAVTMLTGSGADGDLAHALVSLGAARRRAGQIDAARSSLRAGLDLAARCAAASLADTAMTELRASGARPRRRRTTGVSALTPSELRIARMAGEGRTNRQIAQALFITTKTVEDHLTSTYRKLAISSRTELADPINAAGATRTSRRR